jgi:hypothetical protein
VMEYWMNGINGAHKFSLFTPSIQYSNTPTLHYSFKISNESTK